MEETYVLCTDCNAKIKTGTKFCTECGKPVDETPQMAPKVEENQKEPEVPQSDLKSSNKCPNCNSELKADDKFCTECGFKIETFTNCPKCDAPIQQGTSFCTECGINVYEFKPTTIQAGNKSIHSPSSQTSHTPTKDESMEELKQTGKDLMDDVEKTGRGLMKDLGSFLDKSSKKTSEKTIKPARKDQKFLVCDKCGGYYELQSGESPEDFSLECDCGGHLEVKNKHP